MPVSPKIVSRNQIPYLSNVIAALDVSMFGAQRQADGSYVTTIQVPRMPLESEVTDIGDAYLEAGWGAVSVTPLKFRNRDGSEGMSITLKLSEHKES